MEEELEERRENFFLCFGENSWVFAVARDSSSEGERNLIEDDDNDMSSKSIRGIMEGEGLCIGSMDICGAQQESDTSIFVGSQDRMGQ